MTTTTTCTRWFLFAIIIIVVVGQYGDLLFLRTPLPSPVVVQGYTTTLPLAAAAAALRQSKHIFYDSSPPPMRVLLLTSLSLSLSSNGGKTKPIWDMEYVRRIQNDKQQLKAFIQRADEMLRNARQQANIEEIETYSGLTVLADAYLQDWNEVDHSVKALSSNGEEMPIWDNNAYVESIKYDQQKLKRLYPAYGRDAAKCKTADQ